MMILKHPDLIALVLVNAAAIVFAIVFALWERRKAK